MLGRSRRRLLDRHPRARITDGRREHGIVWPLWSGVQLTYNAGVAGAPAAGRGAGTRPAARASDFLAPEPLSISRPAKAW